MQADPDPVMGCGHEASLLLPWFVAGRLDASEVAAVQAHLLECVECRSECSSQRSLLEVLRADDRLEHSPQPALDQLLTRIEELERELPSEVAVVAPPAAPCSRQSHSPVSRWLVAALVLQSVGLALLGSLLFGRVDMGESPARYQTLSSPPAAVAVARVRVVFTGGTTVTEASSLVRELGAEVVAGPTAAGTFALALADGSDGGVARALARLRADSHVVFAEPLEEAAGTPQ